MSSRGSARADAPVAGCRVAQAHPELRLVPTESQTPLAALKEFGFPSEQVAAQDVLEQRGILQLGRQPVQIHVMTYISGVNWDSAWDSKQQGSYGSVPVFFIGRDALVANK